MRKKSIYKTYARKTWGINPKTRVSPKTKQQKLEDELIKDHIKELREYGVE